MTGLPQGWVRAPLMDIIELHDARRIPLNATERASRKGPYPYYGANGQVDSVDDYLFDGEFVLLAEDGGFFDNPARGVAYEAKGQFWVNNHAHILSGRGDIETSFLKSWLNSLDWMQYVSGSTRLKLTQAGMSGAEIPLPPLPEQRRIVRKFDTLSARSTTARTHLTAIEKLVQRYKLAVLSRTLFRNEMPVKRLRDVLTDIRYGTAAKCSYDPTGTPVLRIPNIQSRRIDRSDLKTAHFAKKEIEQLALRAGDILVIRSNGSPDLVGRVALVTEHETDCLFAGYLIRLRLSATEALPEYVRLCFESDEVRAIIEAASKSTSGVNNVNSTQLKEIELPLPAVDEQREIVHRIETAFAKIDRLAAEAAKALKLLGHLDQRILAKAFAGELVPQDPTDEPAEALLARIREARAATPKPKRGRKART
ncbi:restriction endonuclease subunit S [Paracoccus cavernae]|uniref:Restriction endonuclease subunit S n=1 Tax=Paracoccus cavernae TaxID=1571207 RepID=A0ABT8D866_9RHOB|nr:restriction endonuclease subunit S [Paracoccus cavernae]